jgi:hypothetical protein
MTYVSLTLAVCLSEEKTGRRSRDSHLPCLFQLELIRLGRRDGFESRFVGGRGDLACFLTARAGWTMCYVKRLECRRDIEPTLFPDDIDVENDAKHGGSGMTVDLTEPQGR